MKDFRNLKVWERAHYLTLAVYKTTSRFPREEVYGLTSQIRRCSASIAANLAEGCGKRGNNEFQRYLQIASGSASELDYHPSPAIARLAVSQLHRLQRVSKRTRRTEENAYIINSQSGFGTATGLEEYLALSS